MFNYDILENCDLGIQKNGVKSFYNTDNGFKASEWVREPIKKMKTYDCPQMTSALKFRDENGSGSVTENHIGYMPQIGDAKHVNKVTGVMNEIENIRKQREM